MHDTIYRKVIKKSWLSLKWTHLINNRNIPDWKSQLSHVGNSSSIQIFAHNSETETFRRSHKHTCFHTYTFTHIQHRHSVTLKYTYKQHTWVLTLTHVPHVHSCSHTYAPTYSHTLKIPYYTHTQTWGLHPCILSISQRPLLLMLSGIRISTYKFWRDTSNQTIAVPNM